MSKFEFTCVIPKEHRTIFENYAALEASALGVACVLHAHDEPRVCTIHIHAEGDTTMATERFRSRVKSKSIELSGR